MSFSEWMSWAGIGAVAKLIATEGRATIEEAGRLNGHSKSFKRKRTFRALTLEEACRNVEAIPKGKLNKHQAYIAKLAKGLKGDISLKLFTTDRGPHLAAHIRTGASSSFKSFCTMTHIDNPGGE